MPRKKVCDGHDGDGHDGDGHDGDGHDGDGHDSDGRDGDGHDGVDDIVTTMMGKKNMVGMRTIATNCTMIL